MKVINIKKNVLAANDFLAEKLRREFKKKNIFTINIIGSPGCGKTTLLEKTIEHFAGKLNIFTLVGDVQTEADADRLKNAGGRAKQIITVGACHLDARMIEREIELLDLDQIEFLVIENVGNLVCPSSYDLGEDEKVVIVSVPEGDEKPLKYPSIFHRSSLFIVTKTDLLGTSDFSIDKVIENAQSINPALTTMKVSAKTEEGMSDWFNWIQAGLDNKRNQ